MNPTKLCILMLILAASCFPIISHADCNTSLPFYKEINVSALSNYSVVKGEVTRQIFKTTYSEGVAAKPLYLVFPYGQWIASFMRIDNNNEVVANITLSGYARDSGDCQQNNYTMSIGQTNLWLQLYPRVENGTQTFHTQYSLLYLNSTSNLTIWVYHWYYYANDEFLGIQNKHRFCDGAYSERCYTASELDSTCFMQIKDESFAKITEGYTNLGTANFSIWNILYMLAQAGLLVGIFIFLPIMLLVWIREAIRKATGR
jgi:hypothetical protein